MSVSRETRHVSMLSRAFRPLVCNESPKKKCEGIVDREHFEVGTHDEPGHRQKVRAHLMHEGWVTAWYDRVLCRYLRQFRDPRGIFYGFYWQEVDSSLVKAWTQYPPGPGIGDPDLKVA